MPSTFPLYTLRLVFFLCDGCRSLNSNLYIGKNKSDLFDGPMMKYTQNNLHDLLRRKIRHVYISIRIKVLIQQGSIRIASTYIVHITTSTFVFNLDVCKHIPLEQHVTICLYSSASIYIYIFSKIHRVIEFHIPNIWCSILESMIYSIFYYSIRNTKNRMNSGTIDF